PLPFELVIVIDQGEELLTLVESAAARRARQAALDSLSHLAGAGMRCKLILGIRSDFYGPFISMLGAGPARSACRELALEPMSAEHLTDALVGPTGRDYLPFTAEVPFAKYGFSFEDGVAAQIVTESVAASCERQYSALPLLQAIAAFVYEERVRKQGIK